MIPFLHQLHESILLFDGAMGTQLIHHGMTREESMERYVLERPDLIEEIHREYVQAGAQVIAACSFGATRHHLTLQGLASSIHEINTNAIAIARKAAGEACWVAADIGPCGLMFPPMGKADPALIKDIFIEQIGILDDAGPDLYLIETQYDLREALATLDAIRTTSPSPVGVTMTFNRTRRGFFTMLGDSVADCIMRLTEHGADFVGANCTLDPIAMVDLAQILSASSPVPILVQPNAGQPKVEGSAISYPMTPELFVEHVEKMIFPNIRAIGGCCGTTPEHIRQMRSMLKRHSCSMP